MNILRKTRRKLKTAFSRNRGGRNDRDSVVVPSALSAPSEARAETITATSAQSEASTAAAAPQEARAEASTAVAAPPKAKEEIQTAIAAPQEASRAEASTTVATPQEARAGTSTRTAALNETEAPAPAPAPTPTPPLIPAPEEAAGQDEQALAPTPPLIPAPEEAAGQDEQAPAPTLPLIPAPKEAAEQHEQAPAPTPPLIPAPEEAAGQDEQALAPTPPLIPAPEEAAEQHEQAPIEEPQLDQVGDQHQALEQLIQRITETLLEQLTPDENDKDWDDPVDILHNPYFGRGPSFTFEEDQYQNIIFFDDQDSRGYFETFDDYDDFKIDMEDDDPNAVWEDTSLSRPLTDWYLPVGEWRDPWSGLMDQF